MEMEMGMGMSSKMDEEAENEQAAKEAKVGVKLEVKVEPGPNTDQRSSQPLQPPQPPLSPGMRLITSAQELHGAAQLGASETLLVPAGAHLELADLHRGQRY